MSKKLIYDELQNESLTYDELSLKFTEDYLLNELNALEEDGLIIKLKTGKYKLAKKKKYDIIEYNLNPDGVIDVLKDGSKPLFYIAYHLGASKDDTKMMLEKMVSEKQIYKFY